MVDAAEKQNMKSLQLRLANDPDAKMLQITAPKELESATTKELNKIIYDDMEKGKGNLDNRKEHRIKEVGRLASYR